MTEIDLCQCVLGKICRCYIDIDIKIRYYKHELEITNQGGNMSREIFEIVKGMDMKDIATQLALQCAPLITGLKISNMLIVAKEDERSVRTILRRTGISCYRLLQNDKKITFLLFHRKQLEKFLEIKEVSEVFYKEGYTEIHLGRILRVFQIRYQAYMEGAKVFPHEMGLLLGYPVEDVIGFMLYGGKNSLYSGYWKVYEDVAKKLALFKKFEMAKELLIQLVSKGVSMEEIIDYYKERSFYECCDCRRA